ncbi:hypothetical protein [Streptomyces hilarionis]|nr:hypothetical protein [Streptomyces hilarionis]
MSAQQGAQLYHEAEERTAHFGASGIDIHFDCRDGLYKALGN